ncbi:MAG: hypothetical protein ACD_3C00180G0001 [uncultured bacterium (gcode 4)]|uniref:Uncharacterized protein n=1 Tax=uncultured bacterium (gcode 4) TaxID=1234023 RepID=K2GWG8_9BACT|nr:MAG: hypothetical protein ACD_3C00180G0001 [uncultured bacterium (gcode 4)]
MEEAAYWIIKTPLKIKITNHYFNSISLSVRAYENCLIAIIIN